MDVVTIPVLLIEDDRHVQRSMTFQLQKLGYAVTCRDDGETGLAEAIRGEYSLVILDLMLPRLDGFRVCASLRAARPELPIVITSARDGDEDKVRGLDLGADDYLAKPFSLAELAARLRAVQRRTATPEGETTPIIRGPLRLDRRRCELFAAGHPVRLSRREYQLLEILMTYPGRLFSREALLRRVWGDDSPSGARVIDQHLYTLRRRLRPFVEQEVFEVVRDMGVRFADGLEQSASAEAGAAAQP